MPDVLHLQILSPEAPLVDEKAVARVRLRLADDSLISIYPKHAELIAAVAAGVVEYRSGEQDRSVRIPGGILSVKEDHVLVLASGEGVSGAERRGAGQTRFARLAREQLRLLQSARAGGAAVEARMDVDADEG